jgi:hypothetical protein
MTLCESSLLHAWTKYLEKKRISSPITAIFPVKDSYHLEAVYRVDV